MAERLSRRFEQKCFNMAATKARVLLRPPPGSVDMHKLFNNPIVKFESEEAMDLEASVSVSESLRTPGNVLKRRDSFHQDTIEHTPIAHSREAIITRLSISSSIAAYESTTATALRRRQTM